MNTPRKQLVMSVIQGLGFVVLAGIALAAVSAVATQGHSLASYAAARDAAIDTVAVILTDAELQAPDTLPAGALAFTIQNQGSKERGFAVMQESGDSRVASKLEKPVHPGASATMSVKLEAGNYVLYALTDGARDTKLSKELKVVASEGIR